MRNIYRYKMIISTNIAIIVTFLFVSVCDAQDRNVFEKTGISEETRTLKKENRDDQWRVMENINLDLSGWIPDTNFPQQVIRLGSQQPKRRRIRKRKRRPEVISLTDDHEIAENRYSIRRIKRPQHLHEEQELWSQMEADANVKPNKRRRVIPLYHDNFDEKQLAFHVNDKISVFQADEAISEVKVSTETIPDLKTILKQAGGLSLSEILQQKNLSLSDLLKGEKEAILAITEKSDNQPIIEYKNPVEMDLTKKIQDSNNFRLTTSTKKTPIIYDDDVQTATEFTSSESKRYEETTHRVSTKTNNVIVVDFKPNIIGLDITTERIDVSTSSTSTTGQANLETRPKFKLRLPVTSAKLNSILKTSTKHIVKNESTPTTLPSKAYRINISELYGISNVRQNTRMETKEEGPLRMSLDLNSVLENKLLNSTKIPIEATTLEMIPEKLKSITAKDEIVEILKDQKTKEYLSKILEVRNMTIDDLVDLRERGSSQKHLADLFHNKTKEPESRDEPLIGSVRTEKLFNQYHEMLINTTKNEIQMNNNKFDKQSQNQYPLPLELKDSNGDRYVATVEAVEDNSEYKSIEENKDKDKYTVTSFPTYKIQLDKKFKEKQSTSIWKSNYPDLFDDFYQKTHQKGIVEDLSEKYFDDFRAIDEGENTISESGNEKLNVESSGEIYENIDDDSIFIKLPYGVKHAIFASLLIIGISLVIFLTILVIFKWSQKHKKKLCYNGGFSCSKIKSPILQNNERRSFATFMSKTLGRKKHYYKQHLQNMSDTIWENDIKPFQ